MISVETLRKEYGEYIEVVEFIVGDKIGYDVFLKNKKIYCSLWTDEHYKNLDKKKGYIKKT